MNTEETRITIISDLVKIDNYRSHLENSEKFFSDDLYSDHSFDHLKKVHEIYTRYLLDYKKLHEPYPLVIENLEYLNLDIENCIKNHKHQAN